MRLASFVSRLAASFAASLFALVAGCAAPEPTSGTWTYVETSVGKNTCNYDDVVSNGNGTFRLVADGGSYRVEPGDGSAPFHCTLSGDELDCPDRAAEEQSLSGLDATLVIHVVATATVESESEMSGEQRGTVTCKGSGCSAAAAAVGASLPCEFSVDFSAELEEAE